MKHELHNATADGSAGASAALPGKDPIALIIEDDLKFSDMLAFHLRKQGYHPVQQYRGLDACVAARALRPALITLDIILPDLDGWRVLHDLKSDPQMQRVPVLIISVLEESELGEGFGPTMYLQKPMTRSELTEAVTRLAPASNMPTQVLLVDDDPLIGELLGAMLPSPRFAVKTATSAGQAAQSLSAALPDLIMLDLVMPKVSGFEFLETLRADSHTRRLPVLVLTAKHLSAREQHDLSQAAQVTLTKASFTLDRLIEKVRYLERVSSLITPSAAAARRPDSQATNVDVSQFRDDFLAEARECLSRLRTWVEQYAESGDAPSTESAARAAHTLKGASAMMGHIALSDLAAQGEDLLRSVLDGEAQLDETSLTTLRQLHEGMERMVESL